MFTHTGSGTSVTMAEHAKLLVQGMAYTSKNTTLEKREDRRLPGKTDRIHARPAFISGGLRSVDKKHGGDVGKREGTGELTAITDRKLAKSTTWLAAHLTIGLSDYQHGRCI